MDSVNVKSEEQTYTFAENLSDHEGRKLFDSKGYCYSLQYKSSLDDSTTWICAAMSDKGYCKGKVKLTNDGKLIIMREHNHPPEEAVRPSKFGINNSNNITEEEICFKSKSAESECYKYVLKHFPNKHSLKLYESRGHDYALKFQDAIGNSRWRCQYTYKGKQCPGQVCIILEDNHRLSILTDHFHNPFSSPVKFEHMYNAASNVYDTFSLRMNSYNEEEDIVAKFTLLQKELTEHNDPLSMSSPSSDSLQDMAHDLLPTNEENSNVNFKFIEHKNFPNQLLLCDSLGYAYDLIGKLGNNRVYCCQEIYHENVKCEAELLQDDSDQFIVSSQHNHCSKEKMRKYLQIHNVFSEQLGVTMGSKRKNRIISPKKKKSKKGR